VTGPNPTRNPPRDRTAERESSVPPGTPPAHVAARHALLDFSSFAPARLRTE